MFSYFFWAASLRFRGVVVGWRRSALVAVALRADGGALSESGRSPPAPLAILGVGEHVARAASRAECQWEGGSPLRRPVLVSVSLCAG